MVVRLKAPKGATSIGLKGNTYAVVSQGALKGTIDVPDDCVEDAAAHGYTVHDEQPVFKEVPKPKEPPPELTDEEKAAAAEAAKKGSQK